MRAPGRADADTAVGNTALIEGDVGIEPNPLVGGNEGRDGGDARMELVTAGVASGVAGAEGEGDADSTTHIRCDLVATSFATVWARVEYGLT